MQQEILQSAQQFTVMLAIPTAQRLSGKLLATAMKLSGKALRAGYRKIDGSRRSVRHWMKKGESLKNIEVTNDNIKSFERTARKYGVKFALKKDVGKQPPQYLVFFRARDADVLTAAFREYAARQAAREKGGRPSLTRHLEQLEERANSIHRDVQRMAHKAVER